MKIEITLDDKSLNFLENLANELNSNIQNIVKNALNEIYRKTKTKKNRRFSATYSKRIL